MISAWRPWNPRARWITVANLRLKERKEHAKERIEHFQELKTMKAAMKDIQVAAGKKVKKYLLAQKNSAAQMEQIMGRHFT